MQAPKVQRRFPAVRTYHKKRLHPIPEPLINIDDSDDEDEDEDTSPIAIDLVPTIVPQSISQLPSPSSVVTLSASRAIPSVTVVPVVSPQLGPITTSRTISSSATPTATSTPSSTFASVPTVTPSTGTLAQDQNAVKPTGAAKSRSTPVGPIIGVILAIFIIAIPMGIYLYRRHSVKGRMRLRGWVNKRSNPGKISPWIDYREKWMINEPSPAMVNSGSTPVGVPLANGLPYIPPPRPPVPPPAYGGSVNVNGSKSPGSPRKDLPIVGASRVLPVDVPEYVSVTSTYIPTLPDELSIKPGEVLRILAEYDDGWALCLSVGGEKGMVPLECFGRVFPEKKEARKSSRYSSLSGNPYDGIV